MDAVRGAQQCDNDDGADDAGDDNDDDAMCYMASLLESYLAVMLQDPSKSLLEFSKIGSRLELRGKIAE